MTSHALRAGLVVLALVAPLAGISHRASADIDGDSFVSEAYGLRASLPRGWRITESSGYPRTLLWLSRSKPRVRIAIAVDPIAPDCRTGATFCNRDTVSVATTLETHLPAAGFDVRSTSPQSRTPTLDYTIGRAHLRHAVVVIGDNVVSVVLAADSPGDVSAMARTFDRLVQSVRPLASTP
jgi:hypothetical protein